MNHHIIVMAKDPFGSKVKTRLAETIGMETAKVVYARLLYETLTKLLNPPQKDIRIELSLSTEKSKKHFKEAYPELIVTKQCTGNIGTRMKDAFYRAFQDSAESVILIGTDIPGINWSIINQAIDHISNQNVVIGPTKDGGYYLIGMASPGINIFHDIPWSSPNVLSKTIKIIIEQGYQAVFMPELVDIDNERDLRNWQSSLNKNHHEN